MFYVADFLVFDDLEFQKSVMFITWPLKQIGRFIIIKKTIVSCLLKMKNPTHTIWENIMDAPNIQTLSWEDGSKFSYTPV